MNHNISDDILRYENFINNVLKEDLRDQEQQLNKLNEKIIELVQQKHTLKMVTDEKTCPTGFKTQMNLGCNFFMEAAVSDTSTMLLNLGLNHYLECTLPEANRYLDSLISSLEERGKRIQAKAVETKAYIKMMVLSCDALINKRNS